MLAWTQPEMLWVEDDEGAPYIKGDFIVRTDAGYPNRIPTEIHFATDNPIAEPWAVQTPARFPHVADRHFYPDGRCCLWLPVMSPWNARDQFGFRNLLEQLTLFYHRQLVMDANPGSPFPGPQWDHGIPGYLDYLIREWRLPARPLRRILEGVRPVEQCPCASGKTFLRCHEPPANRFRSRAGPDVTAGIIEVLRRAEHRPGTSIFLDAKGSANGVRAAVPSRSPHSSDGNEGKYAAPHALDREPRAVPAASGSGIARS